MLSRVTIAAWRLPAVLLLAVAGCADPGPLTVSDARVRALIPGQDKTAAYFTARNTSDSELVLTGASSDSVRAIEMHTTIRDGDVVGMRRLPAVVIPAGETVRFTPGGRHLMMFGVAALGDSLDIVLETRDGGRIPVRFETMPLSGE